jgi:hypothetical protein
MGANEEVEEKVEEVQPNESESEFLKGGKKSRKRSKKHQGGKKRKVKKTKRRRKQKGGMGNELEQSEEEQQEVVEEEQQEGGKKRKGKKGTKKGKAGKWILHVKEFAKSHKIKYPEALKHPDCKKSYKKM